MFADLKLPDSAEIDTRVRLGVEINRVLASRRLTQRDAARLLGINQPKVSALKHCNLDGFSVERLMNFLTALGHDVEIRVRPRRSPRALGRIVVAAHRSEFRY